MVELADRTGGAREGAVSKAAQLRFGPFSLDLARRALLRGGTRVRLGSRAIAILIALVERANQLVTKDELIAIAWPTTYVEEGALRVHIAAIRRALGDHPDQPAFIANVMGQGYRFVAEVQSERLPQSFMAGPTDRVVRPLVGRDDEAEALLRLMLSCRLVTVVGARGVGKSALAEIVAPQAARIDGRQFAEVDVSNLPSAAGLRSALEDAIGEGETNLVVVLDNCEGRVRATAEVVEEMLSAHLDIAFLVTSTEPLRVANERVYRLSPLATPRRSDLSLHEAMASPAVRLLVDRISEGPHGVAIHERDARGVLALAVRADGYPLALELAACKVQFLGLRGAFERSQTHPLDFAIGPAAMVSRRTLVQAGLDGEELLEVERGVLTRLASFNASFALDDAIHVGASSGLLASDVVTSVTSLVLKSYVTRFLHGDAIRYGIPGHIRANFRAELEKSAARKLTLALHAKWALGRAREATNALRVLKRPEFMELYADFAPDFLDAVEFSLDADASDGAAATLLIAAIPTLLCCGRHREVRAYADRLVAGRHLVSPAQSLRLRLLLAVIQEDMVALRPETVSILGETAALRLALNDEEADAEALLVDAALMLRRGLLAQGLESARLASKHAHNLGDRPLEQTALRLSAELLHYSADQAGFAETAEKALARPGVLSPMFGTVTSYPPSAIRVLQAKTQWLTGRPDLANASMTEAYALAREGGPWAQCEMLALGQCLLAFWQGDMSAAMLAVDELDAIAAHENLPHWSSWCALYRAINRRRIAPDDRTLTGQAPHPLGSFLQKEAWATLSGSLEGTGLNAENASPWCRPEIMRLEGLSLLAAGHTVAGEALLVAARDAAADMGLAAWNLRASLSLAKYWCHRDPQRGVDALSRALKRYPEDAMMPDLSAARSLLDLLR